MASIEVGNIMSKNDTSSVGVCDHKWTKNKIVFAGVSCRANRLYLLNRAKKIAGIKLVLDNYINEFCMV